MAANLKRQKRASTIEIIMVIAVILGILFFFGGAEPGTLGSTETAQFFAPSLIRGPGPGPGPGPLCVTDSSLVRDPPENILGQTVDLINVASTQQSVVISVNGIQEIVTGSERVGNFSNVTVVSAKWVPDMRFRSATIKYCK